MYRRILTAILVVGSICPTPFVCSLTAQTQTAAAKSEPTYRLKIDFNTRVKMRDGVELSADVYRPDTPGKFPVIVSRTPYVKSTAGALRTGKYWAEHGYVYVAMDVRGRGDSDGVFVAYRNDGRDGYDAIEWAAAQPWSTGKVGTTGGSYLGRNQWITAVLQPPHLVTMVALVTPSDAFVEWPTGVPGPMDVSWYHFTAGHVSQVMDAVDWPKVHKHLPLITMDEAAGRPSSEWKKMFDHPKYDDWWAELSYQDKYDKVKVPVLHISGWYDDEQIGTPLNYIGMTTKGPSDVRKSQHLLMGPWPHAVNSTSKLGEVDFGPSGVIDLNGNMLRWFDHWLKGTDNGVMKEPPVRIFVMGENQWVNENEWPMARTKWTKYYVHSNGRANSIFGDGKLSTEAPKNEPQDGYKSDPQNPVPFITEPSFAQIGSADDYRPVQRRDDVLVYTSEPLKEDTEVCGPIKAQVWASSTAKDADFMAMLQDVWPNGYTQRLIDGMVRARFRDGMTNPTLIEPGKIYAYNVDMWNTCNTFKAGHSIRVQIASQGFPKYDRNPQTGAPLGRTTDLQTAEQKIYHDEQHPTHVVLPIVSKQ